MNTTEAIQALVQIIKEGGSSVTPRSDAEMEASVTTIMDSLINDTVLYVNTTSSEINTIISEYNSGNGTGLTPGVEYKLADIADAGVILKAISRNRLSLSGQGIFLNPDHQDDGNWTGLEAITDIPKGTNHGVWHKNVISFDYTNGGGNMEIGDTAYNSGDPSITGLVVFNDGDVIKVETTKPLSFWTDGLILINDDGDEITVGTAVESDYYPIGDIVIWGGIHYQIIDDLALDGTEPSSSLGMFEIGKTEINVGYVTEIDYIHYDYNNGVIVWQEDKRGNRYNPDAITSFQRGNDLVKNNYIGLGADIDCINQRGAIIANTLSDTVTVQFDNTHEGQVTGCTFGGGNTITANFELGKSLNICTVAPVEDITFSSNSSYQGSSITPFGTTFREAFILEEGVTYNTSESTMIIPLSLNYLGELVVEGENAAAINKISNLSSVHDVILIPKNGVAYTFGIVGMSDIGADKLLSPAGAYLEAVGRTNGGDTLTFRKYGNVNVLVRDGKISVA